MKTINQNSFLILLGMIFLVGSFFVLWGGFTLPRVLGVFALAAVLGLVWYAVRPQQSPQDELERFEDQIGGEMPVLLEFQSPY
ncbi:MAG: hypothetical protein R6U57_07295 [Anaerolineales bacterium]